MNNYGNINGYGGNGGNCNGYGGNGGNGVHIGGYMAKMPNSSGNSANSDVNIHGEGGNGGDGNSGSGGNGGDGVHIGDTGNMGGNGGSGNCGNGELMYSPCGKWILVATPNSTPIPACPERITFSLGTSVGVIYANKGDYTYANHAVQMTDTGYFDLIPQIGTGHYDVSFVAGNIKYSGKGICNVGC